MLKELNRITNSDFTEGKRKPRGWQWEEHHAGIHWRPVRHAGNGDARGIELFAEQERAGGGWSQSFTLRKDQHYRVEAVVSCDFPVPSRGLTLTLTALDAGDHPRAQLATAPLTRATDHVLRAYFQTPAKARRATLTVQIHGTGHAVIHDVRVIPVMEPESRSHPWALPAPPLATAAPVRVKRVAVLTKQPDRPVIALLRARLGKANVTVHATAKAGSALERADAVLLLDGPIPGKLRKLRGLKQFAAKRIVLVSLKTMETISDEHLITRKVTQIDDPLHARVAYADFVTAGFALRDIFPFAAQPDSSPRMEQRQFRTNKVFREYCGKHGFEVLLESETDAEKTSEKPIALFWRGDCGAIVAMDIEPVEAITPSFDGPVPAARLLMNLLGAKQPLMGQFTAPARNPDELLSHLRDTVERYPQLAFADESALSDPHAPKLVLMGKPEETVGQPLVPRPMVLLRSGLTGTDMNGVYGTLLWLKQMLRPAPFTSPYAHTLDRAFRLAWMPLAAPLHSWGGWQPPVDHERYPLDIEFEPGSLAAGIDVTCGSTHRLRVVCASGGQWYDRLARMLPPLASALLTGRHFYHAGDAGSRPGDRTAMSWRTDDLSVAIEQDATAFTEDWQNQALQAGAELMRIELPPGTTDPAAASIWQTDWVATLLELITGLMLGTIVVNRDPHPLNLELPPGMARGLAQGVFRKIGAPHDDLPVPPVRGGKLTLPAGHALIATS
jgi:hypothetical protein